MESDKRFKIQNTKSTHAEAMCVRGALLANLVKTVGKQQTSAEA